MYETIKRLFLAGKLNETALKNAVRRGWITARQAEEFIQTETGEE